MSQKLQFDLVSPESLLVSQAVDSVFVPGSEGDMGVYAQHAPVISALRPGVLTVTADGTENRYYVRGGFLDVSNEGLTVLAEHAIALSDFSAELREAELAEARTALANAAHDQARLQAQQVIDTIEAL